MKKSASDKIRSESALLQSLEKTVNNLSNQLDKTAGKLNVLCEWIAFKFIHDSSLPEEIGRNRTKKISPDFDSDDTSDSTDTDDDINNNRHTKLMTTKARQISQTSNGNMIVASATVILPASSFSGSDNSERLEINSGLLPASETQPGPFSTSEVSKSSDSNRRRRRETSSRAVVPNPTLAVAVEDDDDEVTWIGKEPSPPRTPPPIIDLLDSEDEPNEDKDNEPGIGYINIKAIIGSESDVVQANHVPKKDGHDLPCPDCGKVFKYKVTLFRHMLRFHPEKHEAEVEVDSAQNEVQCTICKVSFGTPAMLEIHKRNGTCRHSPTTCDRCGVIFWGWSALSLHLRDVHNVDKPFICPTCGLTVDKWNSYVRHRNTHSESAIRKYKAQELHLKKQSSKSISSILMGQKKSGGSHKPGRKRRRQTTKVGKSTAMNLDENPTEPENREPICSASRRWRNKLTRRSIISSGFE